MCRINIFSYVMNIVFVCLKKKIGVGWYDRVDEVVYII